VDDERAQQGERLVAEVASEGVLARSQLLAAVAPVASFHHVQNAYAKIGVSTRAAAALFAMQHGLTAWGELPIVRTRDRS
jgi:hypothetical protein